MNFPKIGMRNIKTSTSVFLCLLVFEFLNRDNAIHACIAAIICMQNTIDDSFKKGTERVIGTIIGGIAGALVLYFVETFKHEELLLFIIPFGIVLLIEICVSLKLKQSVVICCVVYLGILISREEGGYILYTLNRVIDTTLGIMITIIINKYMKIPDEVKLMMKFYHPKTKKEYIQDVSAEISEDENSQLASEPDRWIEIDEKK